MWYRLIRKIRMNNKISTAELARCCGIRQQSISDIELGKKNAGPAALAQLQQGFAGVIEERRQSLSRLEKDFKKHKHHLLDYTEELL